MIKRALIYIAFFTILTGLKEGTPQKLKHTPHRAFKAGEKLEYSLGYGFISAGTASLEVTDTVFDNKKLFHIKLTGKTVGLADIIYKVRDVYESYTDPGTDLPVKAVRKIKEGGYRYYNEVTYNRDSSTITSLRSGVKHVPEETLDILSAFYYARNHYFNQDLKKGDVISFVTYFSDKIFPFKIRYVGTEVINSRFGKIECYKFAPVTEVGRAFKSNEGMYMWISKDKNRIPIKVKFELVVGSFVCNLENFSGLKHPFSSIQFSR
ncbi:MAG: DUF3108 domain-containing protein [Chlorobi bacterium]|nr:DUF3108 domain-containing protein [Chlorobiota bacterium]